MINGLLMFLSAYTNNKLLKRITFALFVIYILFKQDFEYMVFSLINLIILVFVPLGISLIKKKISHSILSILSILIYSILIDIICYFMFKPDVNIIWYIWQGILFNLKSTIMSILLFAVIVFYQNIWKSWGKINENKIISFR